jgi:hypothetical protein
MIILMLLLPAVMLVATVILRTGQHDLSDMTLFVVLLWFYYGFSVPIDILIQGRTSTVWFEIDYWSQAGTYGVILCSIAFYLFAIGAALGSKLPLKKIRISIFKISPPPFWLVIVCLCAVFAVSYEEVVSLTRMERSKAGGSVSSKLINFLEFFVLAVSCIYILVAPHTGKVKTVLLLMVSLAIFSGDRSSAMLPVFAALIRFRPKVSRKQIIIIGFAFITLLFLWKPTYTCIRLSLAGETIELAKVFKDYGLSMIESSASYNMLVWSLTEDLSMDWPSGYSLLILPVLIGMPRFLLDVGQKTLGEAFLQQYRPELLERGGGAGFGGLPEFYLNFGWFGPLLLGFMVGICLRYAKTMHHGLVYFVLFLCLFRLFRSDVASIFKSYVVMFGGSMLLWSVFALFAVTLLKWSSTKKWQDK